MSWFNVQWRKWRKLPCGETFPQSFIRTDPSVICELPTGHDNDVATARWRNVDRGVEVEQFINKGSINDTYAGWHLHSPAGARWYIRFKDN
jgi:hypothetical protein